MRNTTIIDELQKSGGFIKASEVKTRGEYEQLRRAAEEGTLLRLLLDEEKHSAAEMAETELIPMQFAYQILRKLSAGELVQVSRGAAGGCRLSCDLRGVSLYDLMAVMGEHDVLCACMEPGYDCRWQSEHGKCAIHCQLTELQRKQDEAFRAVSMMRSPSAG